MASSIIPIECSTGSSNYAVILHFFIYFIHTPSTCYGQRSYTDINVI